MNGYEHDLGRSETNLDVFYPILNLFLALNPYFAPDPKSNIAGDILSPAFLGRSFTIEGLVMLNIAEKVNNFDLLYLHEF